MNKYEIETEKIKKEAKKLLEEMKKENLKGNCYIDETEETIIWQISKDVQIHIHLAWHGGDDTIEYLYKYSEKDYIHLEEDNLFERDNKELLNIMKELNNETNYIFSYSDKGLFSKQSEYKIVWELDKELLQKYKDNPKYNLVCEF